MDDFTDALMTALRTGSDDPERGALGMQMRSLVADLVNDKSSKAKKASASKELAKVREAYRRRLLLS